MRRLALIPARGGSKRIPRKNIREFEGKPIIAYSIAAACDSGLFDSVVVSTDDEEIAAIARHYNASVPFLRSTDNANDHATTVDVICEVINCLSERGEQFQQCCCVYPCAPLITAELLKRSFELLVETQADSVIPVETSEKQLQRAMRIHNDRLHFERPEFSDCRSQDLAHSYFDTGQFYSFEIEPIVRAASMLTANTVALTIDSMRVQNIDTEDDWLLALWKYRYLHRVAA
ncbi:MAG: pseudaminic acid cytidylyltransferase [Pseudomonadota bacterium]